nr:immunoglobulin heavy chain junction region [Macaca mulatta]MOY21858.1 immunoglobulin heavy chain junction region [Macaca mulatta]MOY22546.1 immunoglobulin heavy chain junction region [Macaca mulatta]MOY23833.1 immunoglobulin heavy chain junction region [Macaca mulatta]MOY25571.1 immunoglobulin heavy chain junction region [Macaca mulatta]
CAKGSEDFDSW